MDESEFSAPAGSNPNLDWVRSFYRKLASGGRRTSRDERRRAAASNRASQPFGQGRDPLLASEAISGLVSDYGWSSELDRARLFMSWREIVGEDTAAAAEPIELANGRLIVRCRSTAWATQLRLLESGFIKSLNVEFPQLEISEIHFIGPNAPSWRRGGRSVPGRGPRDTYG
jgi:predicted nucleic acid-binding Zn ribbon protein